MTEDKSIKHKGASKTYWKLKLEAMSKLGDRCMKCGETDIRVLQIAHKGAKPLGNTHKRNNTKNIGVNLYKRIISGEVDDSKVELLCSNCNVLYEFEIGRRNFPEEFPIDDVKLASEVAGKYKHTKIEDPVVMACSKETKQRMIDMFGKEGTWNDVINKMLDEFEQLGGKINAEIKAG